MSNGKGDTPRPLSVPADEYARRWAQTFGGAYAGFAYAHLREGMAQAEDSAFLARLRASHDRLPEHG